MLDGPKCTDCRVDWDTEFNKSEICVVNKDQWTTIMHKVFNDWSFDERHGRCSVKPGYSTMYTQILQGMQAKEFLLPSEYNTYEGILRQRMWLADDPANNGCIWMFHAGSWPNKYMSFGCLHCGRGSSAYLGDPYDDVPPCREIVHNFFERQINAQPQ